MQELIDKVLSLTSAYEANVIALGGDKKTQSTKMAAKRETALNSPAFKPTEEELRNEALGHDIDPIPTTVEYAHEVLFAMLQQIQTHVEKFPIVAPAFVHVVKEMFLPALREEESYFLLGMDGKALREGTSTVSVKETQELRDQALALFTALQVMNLDVSSLPTETKDGKTFLSLSRMPRNSSEKSAASRSANKKIVWTIDGRQLSGVSMVQVRKSIGCATVQDIRDAFKGNYADGQIHSASIIDVDGNVKRVTVQSVAILSVEELSAVSEVEDDETDELDVD